MAFTVSNSVGKRLENAAFARTENCRKSFQKIGYSLTFSWCRVTCDEPRVFFLVLLGVKCEFAICFQISENVGVMMDFSVFHHFRKLTMNEGFCAVLILNFL